MLIVENVGLPITSGAKVYDNVMEVWTKALTAVDKLVSGMAQNIQSSEVLLGLSAWHLYPDMCVLGKETTHVQQGDNLVKQGGLMTIGVRRAHSNASTEVSWSMSLAHLRYYGKPVLSEGSISSKSTRIPFDRLVLVAIGSLISRWELQATDFDDVARFLVLLWKCLEPEMKKKALSTTPWLEMLSQHASRFLDSSGHERMESSRLIALGCRRFGSFLAEPREQPKPFLGISDPVVYFDLLPPEILVTTLRERATKYDLGVDVRGAFVRYDPDDSEWRDPNFADFTCYASLFPQTMPDKTTKMHRRWIQVPSSFDIKDKRTSEKLRRRCIDQAIRRSITLMRESGEPCGILPHNMITEDGDGASILDWSGGTNSFTPTFLREWASRRNANADQDEYGPSIQNSLETYSHLPESFLRFQTARSSTTEDEGANLPETLNGWDLGASEHDYGQKKYKPLFQSSKAAIYQPYNQWKDVKLKIKLTDIIKLKINLTDIVKALASNSIRGHKLEQHLLSYNVTRAGHHAVASALYFKSLENLHLASEIYSSLSGSEVGLSVLSTALHKATWGLNFGDVSMSRARSFACIVMFETGGLDIQSNYLEDVVAISSGNSLYVSELLLCDPYPAPKSHLVRYLVGNVGKPGLSLLLLPENPIHREPDLDTWELVNHAKFEGTYEDNFKGTSLHLSLTGYEQALNIGKQGGRDKEVYYLEAVVAALDNGTWVADLDILYRSFQSKFRKDMSVGNDGHYHLPTHCRHTPQNRADFGSTSNHLTSTDNWFEVFDCPSNASIVRARGNWIARLALAATSMNQKRPMIIGSQEICWACVGKIITSAHLNPDKQVILC